MKKNHKYLHIFICFFVLLLSNKVYAKVPEINILVAQYENSLEFMMPEGGIWSCGNQEFGELLPGITYKITGKLQTQAQRKYHLMVATVDILDDGRLMDLTEKYHKMGFKKSVKIDFVE